MNDNIAIHIVGAATAIIALPSAPARLAHIEINGTFYEVQTVRFFSKARAFDYALWRTAKINGEELDHALFGSMYKVELVVENISSQ